MDVDVDEPGADDATGGIDHVRGGRVGQRPDRHDPIAAHPDVGGDRRRAAAVDDRPAADQQVEVHRLAQLSAAEERDDRLDHAAAQADERVVPERGRVVVVGDDLETARR